LTANAANGKRGDVAGKTREPRLGAAVREWQVAARKQCFDRPDQRVAHIEKRLEPVEG